MAKKKMLTATTTQEDALKLVASGDVPIEAYQEWDATRAKSKPAYNGNSECQITKGDFLDKAGPLTVVVDGTKVSLEPREFSSGSFGWYYSGKLNIEVDGKPIKAQVGLNFTVVNSKPKK